MFRRIAPAVLILTACMTLLPARARADKPSKVEIGRRGKVATAFVEVPGTSGTAFCIHSSGLFVTNEHVVRRVKSEEVTLTLEPAQPSQRTLKATVVRRDKDADLALLRVNEAVELPSLTLGSTEGVAELADVVACGFPLGKSLSRDKKEYPAISVNGGTVTALRQKEGELEFLQIDVALTFGNSGGPVLDDNGHVIGVVVSGIPGQQGLNQAIPVGRLARFLKAPDLSLVAPELTKATAGKLHFFKARAVSLLPESPEPDLRLILQSGDAEAREFPMQKQDGIWVASVIPIERSAPPRVEISARLGSGTISGKSDDIVIKIADQVARLSSVRRIDWTPKPSIVMSDERKIVDTTITGLEHLSIDLGGQLVDLDLTKVTQLIIQPTVEETAVLATVVASMAGQEAARLQTRIAVSDATLVASGAQGTANIVPPPLASEKVVKRLPELFSDVVVGGGGRYLIFHLPKLKKLGVFDVNEARVTKYIPLSEDDVAFAAGMNSLIVGLRRANRLERWNLTTGEQELSAVPPFKEEISSILMGHASGGPVFVNGYALDAATFRLLTTDRSFPDSRKIVSADGTVFTGWNTNQSPDTASAFVIDGTSVKRYDEGGLMHVVPGPDGRTIYTAKGLCSTTLKRSNPDDASYGYCLPAVHGDYFLSMTSATGGKGGGFTVYLRGLGQPIARLNKADHGLSFDGWDRETFGPWKRVFMVPDARLIAVLPPTNDQVVLHHFDAEAALESSGLDYLLVTSRAPREARAGDNYTYPVVVKSKHKVTYKLDSAPKSMEVSPQGLITWAVPREASGDQNVILTIVDSAGQEIFHTFTIRIKA